MSLADFFNSDRRTARGWDALDKTQGKPTTKDANARLMRAYRCDGLEMAEQALKAGACPDLLVETGREHGGYGYGTTIYSSPLLIVAARHGMRGFASLLLKHGAKTEVRENHRNWTALHYAADRGDTPMVRLLLDAGADPGPQHYGQPHGIAHEKQYTDITDMLKNEPARREAQRQAAVQEAIRAHKEAEQRAIDAQAAAAAAAIALKNKAPSVTQTGQSITVMEPLKIKKASRSPFA